MSEPVANVDWDAEAAAFDDEPDHGLRDPEIRRAWADRLRGWLPAGAADILDLGCGTGTLSLLAAEQGHHVTGVDLSPAMVDLARAKLAGRDAAFLVGDAAAPRWASSASTSSSYGMCCGPCPTPPASCGTGADCSAPEAGSC